MTLRFGDVYGAGAGFERTRVGAFIGSHLPRPRSSRAALDREIVDLLHVDDLVRGLLSAAVAPGVGGCVVQLANREAVGRRALIEALQVLLPQSDALAYDYMAASDTRRTFDTSAAERLLEWEPRVGLEEGVAGAVGWVGRCAAEWSYPDSVDR